MKKLGLALSSGGARGLAHIGVLKVLSKNGINISCIAGTSVGAIVAAYYALNLEIESLEGFVNKLCKKDIMGLFDLNDPRISLIKGLKVKAFYYRLFGEKTFDDVKIPLRIISTSLDDGREFVFDSGRIIDAVMASSAMPSIFPVIKYKGKSLIDGAFSNIIPISQVKKLGAEVVIAVDLFSKDSFVPIEYNNFRTLTRTYEIIMEKLTHYKIKEDSDNLLVLKPCLGTGLQLFEFYKLENIKAGEEETERMLLKIKRKLR